MTSEQRLARAFLTTLDQPDDATLAQLVVDHGVLGTAEMVAAAGYRPLDWETQALRLLDRARRQHVRFVVPADEDWPAVVSRSSAAGAGPLGLWVSGDGEPAELLRRSVVVLGSRTATPYAAGLAFRLAGELSAAGWTVVTSGAVGVASAALRGALVDNRPAVAVPLGGALRPVPVVHAGLLRRVRRFPGHRSDDGTMRQGATMRPYDSKGRVALSDGVFRAALPPATSIREVARQQGVRPFQPGGDVRLDLWDTDEEFQAFFADVRASRQDDWASS